MEDMLILRQFIEMLIVIQRVYYSLHQDTKQEQHNIKFYIIFFKYLMYVNMISCQSDKS